MSSTSSNVLEVRTVQSGAFKTLIEASKELLSDTCIEFDQSGMKVVSMDTSHIVLVHLKLDAARFEYYYCKSRLVIGLNMINFHRLIKTLNSSDTLTLYVDEVEFNQLGIRLENIEKNTRTTFKLNLLDLDNPKITVNPAEFNSVIALPSSDFQKIIRDCGNISDLVEIKNIGKQLFFSCKGDFCTQETVLADQSSQATTINGSDEEIVQGVFSLKFLSLFTKCTNLSNTVELYLKNDYPLICVYAVASLGTLKLCLSPAIERN
jgi:proliferating cell nuclear antigen